MGFQAGISGDGIDDRTKRALQQKMSVLEESGGLYIVVSESGSEYQVDTRKNRCTCPDYKHRNAVCKHIRRVDFATGIWTLKTG